MKYNLKLSIVCSFYNEELCIENFVSEIKKNIEHNVNDFEIIFVNDCSTDSSKNIIENLCISDQRIKLINTSRRFGNQECIFAGLENSSGDAVVILDIDLQDPPKLILEMLKKFNEGYEVVHTKRRKREGESYIKLKLTKYAYKIINFFSDIDLPENSGIFKLIGRRVLNHAITTGDHDPYIRGMFFWTGFRQTILEYDRLPRKFGHSKYNIFKTINPWKEVVRGITTFSMAPLYFSLFLGFIVSITSFFLIIYFSAQYFFLDFVTSGWTSLILTILFTSGIIFLILGVIGIYVGKIYEIIRKRPKYIIESKKNFK